MLTGETTAMRTVRRLAAGALFLLAALMALKLALMLVKGGETALIIWHGKGIFAGHPLKYLAIGLGALFGGWALLLLPHSGKREWAQFAGKLLLLLLSASLSLGAAELGVRAYYIGKLRANSLEHLKRLYRAGQKPEVHTSHPMSYIIQPADDPHIVYELQPNLEMDFGHRRVHMNSAGMRSDREYPLARQPGSVRIAGVGDSGMFGWDVEQHEPYLAVLQDNLNRRADGATYEVLNFAVPGYNTQLEAETLCRKVLAYRPDVVVVGWCENDFELPFFMLEQKAFLRRDMSFLYQRLFNRSYPLEREMALRFTEQRAFNVTNVLAEIKVGTGVEGCRQALRMMQAASRQHQFQLLLFGAMGKEIQQLCQELGVPYYNIEAKIPKQLYPADYALFFMHPAPPGHRVLADYLERELAGRGWLKPRVPRPATPGA